jgi:formylglycine-generating enzyme required for sulfatase activity
VYYKHSHGTEVVGSKKPSGTGVYDMSGNVLEWVEDCWHDTYERAPTDGSVWLGVDGGDCDRRVVRGGSWFDHDPGILRVSSREGGSPDGWGYALGFRLVQDIP